MSVSKEALAILYFSCYLSSRLHLSPHPIIHFLHTPPQFTLDVAEEVLYPTEFTLTYNGEASIVAALLPGWKKKELAAAAAAEREGGGEEGGGGAWGAQGIVGASKRFAGGASKRFAGGGSASRRERRMSAAAEAPAEEEGGDPGVGSAVGRARSRRRSALPPPASDGDGDRDSSGIAAVQQLYNSGTAKPGQESSTAGPVAEGLEEQSPGPAPLTVPVASASFLTPSRSEALLEQDGGSAAAPSVQEPDGALPSSAPDPGRSELDLAGSAGGAPPSGGYGFREIDPLTVRCEPSSPSTHPLRDVPGDVHLLTFLLTCLLTYRSEPEVRHSRGYKPSRRCTWKRGAPDEGHRWVHLQPSWTQWHVWRLWPSGSGDEPGCA